MYSNTIDVIDTFCDECETFSLTAKESDHEDGVIEFHCRVCKLDWIEYA